VITRRCKMSADDEKKDDDVVEERRSGEERRISVLDLIEDIDRRIEEARRLADRIKKDFEEK